MSLYRTPEEEKEYQKKCGEIDKKVESMTNAQLAMYVDEHAYWYIEYIHDGLCEKDDEYWDAKMEVACIWEAVKRLKDASK